jgi:transcriptional regulator with XRE-family HTH domain
MKTIKDLRKAKKLSQIDLADKAGVSLPWIQKIEQGAALGTSKEVQMKIAKVLGEWPKDFIRPAGAFYKDEIYGQPNPVIKEPIRLFIADLQERAAKGTKLGESFDRDSQRFIQEAIDNHTFFWFQMLLSLAKILGVKLPKI